MSYMIYVDRPHKFIHAVRPLRETGSCDYRCHCHCPTTTWLGSARSLAVAVFSALQRRATRLTGVLCDTIRILLKPPTERIPEEIRYVSGSDIVSFFFAALV
ncbi:hypothetical protein LSAT2_004167 [Lamellibrachia satsuma]|nr:hypothetical protein LSAT2_004167 [Lamellibrachia satsuma]